MDAVARGKEVARQMRIKMGLPELEEEAVPVAQKRRKKKKAATVEAAESEKAEPAQANLSFNFGSLAGLEGRGIKQDWDTIN